MDEQRDENKPGEESEVEGHGHVSAKPLSDKHQIDESDDDEVEAHSPPIGLPPIGEPPIN
jgi:hypothetical protein